MVDEKSIRDALSEVEEAVMEAETFADITIDLAGIDKGAPGWPYLVSQYVRRIRNKLEGVRAAVYPDSVLARERRGESVPSPLDEAPAMQGVTVAED